MYTFSVILYFNAVFKSSLIFIPRIFHTEDTTYSFNTDVRLIVSIYQKAIEKAWVQFKILTKGDKWRHLLQM